MSVHSSVHSLWKLLLEVPAQKGNELGVDDDCHQKDVRGLDSDELSVRLVDAGTCVPVKALPRTAEIHILAAVNNKDCILVLVEQGSLNLGENSGGWDSGKESHAKRNKTGQDGLINQSTHSSAIHLTLIQLLRVLQLLGAKRNESDGRSDLAERHGSGRESNFAHSLERIRNRWEAAEPRAASWGGDDDVRPSHTWDGEEDSNGWVGDDAWHNEVEGFIEVSYQHGVDDVHAEASEAAEETSDGAEVLVGAAQGGGDWSLLDDGGFTVLGWEHRVLWGVFEVDVIGDHRLDQDGGWSLDHGQSWDQVAVGVCCLSLSASHFPSILSSTTYHHKDPCKDQKSNRKRSHHGRAQSLAALRWRWHLSLPSTDMVAVVSWGSWSSDSMALIMDTVVGTTAALADGLKMLDATTDDGACEKTHGGDSFCCALCCHSL